MIYTFKKHASFRLVDLTKVNNGSLWLLFLHTPGEDKHTEEPYGPWMIKVMKVIKKYTEARFLPEFDYNLDLARPVGFDHENHKPMPASGSWTYEWK